MSRATLVVAAICWLSLPVFALSPARPGYYGLDFYEQLEGGLANEALILRLNEILKGGHVPGPQGFDRVFSNCQGQSSCSIHTSLGYGEARKHLFGSIHLEQITGLYAVKDVYCEEYVTEKQAQIGPGQIPSAEHINTEHTWPQSRFTSRYPKDVQKCDLHHLYPTDTKMNSHRSSLRFGEVAEDMEDLKCPQSRLGHSSTGSVVFEPPDRHKGNVARAIFYFATRYQMKVSDDEESFLRQWNEDDPVDEAESRRNEEVYQLQKTRNPFIDFPDLAKKIRDF